MNTAPPFGAREGKRELKRCPHQRHGKNSDQGGCACEAGSCQGQAAAEAAQHILSGDVDSLEIELGQKVCPVSYRVDGVLEDQARCGALHNHDRNAAFGRGIRIGSAEHR